MPRRLLIALLLSALLSGLGPPTAARAAAAAHPRARPNAVAAPAPATPSGARTAQPAAASSGAPFGHIPCDLYNAYAATPIAGADDGAGQTIAVIDPYGTLTITEDFAAFSQAFGLGGPALRVVAPKGVDLTQPDAPGHSTVWTNEIPLGVEWAHAMAPAAQVVLVEARTSTDSDLLDAIYYAVHTLSADVVNMSWTFDESTGPTPYDSTTILGFDSNFPATNGAGRGITYFAAAGDVPNTAVWPAVSPNVVAVGGTSITPAGFAAAGTGAHACTAAPNPPYAPGNESAWASSGGGPSAFEPRPAYQSGLAPGSHRVTPDVAMLADPTTGVALYTGGAWATTSWGGTSLAAPLWAGLTARLNQVDRVNRSQVPWVYAAYGRSPAHTGFNDVPPAGYDVPTGLGSPILPALRGGLYHPLVPSRIFDSRDPASPHFRRFEPGESYTLPVVAASEGATAAVLNVGVTNVDGARSSYVLVSAADEPRPAASTVNVVAGQTVANLAQVKLSRAGAVTIYNAAGYLDVFVDLAGYYLPSVSPSPSVPAPGTGLYSALPAPARRLDTRNTNTPLGPGDTVVVQVAGWTDPATHRVPVPAGASAVVVNLTEVGGNAPSYLAAWPDGTARPPVSNLNFPAGRVIANRAIVPVGQNGSIDVYNSAGTAHVLVDLEGWFSGGGPGDSAGARFLPVTPSRIFDTRTGLGGRSTPLLAGESARVAVAAPAAAAAALNVTGLDARAYTYIGVYPGAPSAQPTSDINLGPGDILPNHAATGLSGSSFYLYNSAGSVNIFVDLAGFYA